jgi:hypothetical protein
VNIDGWMLLDVNAEHFYVFDVTDHEFQQHQIARQR